MPILIFDLDGTLIDSAPSILASLAMALEEGGVTPRVPLESGLIGPPLQETLARLTGTEDVETLQTYVDAFKRHYDEGGYKETVSYSGIAAMLMELHARGCQMHLATNKRLAPTLLILDYLGWTGYFGSIYALDRYQPRLADKGELLHRMLAEEGIRNEDAVYIGDKLEDAAAAEKNGLPFIGVKWGYGDFGHNAKWPILESPLSLLERL